MIKLKNKPLVSVLICTFNAASFIESTLNSVLSQTYAEMEVLILDNASGDNTSKIIRAMAQKDKRLSLYESKTNMGAYPGLNFLIDRAKGAYIAVNDHDDIWHPEKLEKQIALLESYNHYVGCGSAIINWYEKYGKYVYRSQSKEAKIAWHTSLVFRNQGYRYDTSITVATDFYFMTNILCNQNRRIFNYPEPYVLRRIFSLMTNLSGQWMMKTPLLELLKLKIGFIDKLSLINRRVLPPYFIDKLLQYSLTDNIPNGYISYYKALVLYQ